MNLEAVHEEDRTIVQNVVVAIQALKKERVLTTWTVSISQQAYVITAYIADGIDFEFGSRSLDQIHDVSPLRVISVSCGRENGRAILKVLVSTRDQPLMLTETQVFHVRKRSRWETVTDKLLGR